MISTVTFPRERGRALVLVVSCGGALTRYPLVDGDQLVLGRQREADVVIDHETVSRKHCTLYVGETLQLEDGGGRNGTFVGGRRIAHGQRVDLSVGASFDVGAATLIVHYDDAVAAPARDEHVPREPAMRALADLIRVIAPTTLPVLIFGETGTGKERVAESIHAQSKRATKALVRINCAAMSESLLESELFGHERGAFTGAIAAREGLFEAADGGTLFFDEVGEMSAAMQAKLLRVMESGEVLRVGSVRPRTVDVRFIGATHRDLPAMVADGRFREDLYYRFNGFALGLPPLRERREDLLPIAEHLLGQIAARGPAPVLSATARARLLAHDWPGNVRELKTVLERAVVLANGGPIESEHVMLDRRTSRAPSAPAPSAAPSRLTRDDVLRALASAGGNQKQAALALGVSRPTLAKYMDALGIARPRKG